MLLAPPLPLPPPSRGQPQPQAPHLDRAMRAVEREGERKSRRPAALRCLVPLCAFFSHAILVAPMLAEGTAEGAAAAQRLLFFGVLLVLSLEGGRRLELARRREWIAGRREVEMALIVLSLGVRGSAASCRPLGGGG